MGGGGLGGANGGGRAPGGSVGGGGSRWGEMGLWGGGIQVGQFGVLFRFRFRTTCPRLQHSRRGTQKTRGSQPPQGGLLGPAWKGRSGRPVAAPRATGGRHLPSFGGGGPHVVWAGARGL